MNLLTQPPKSRTCGQHCVAMVAAISVDQAIEAVGKKGPTSAIDICAGLTKLGFTPASKLNRFIYKKELPSTCILRINWDKGSHWVVYNDGYIYDPAYGVYKYSKQDLANLPNFKNCLSFLRIR